MAARLAKPKKAPKLPSFVEKKIKKKPIKEV
jgi:hypothetical protein